MHNSHAQMGLYSFVFLTLSSGCASVGDPASGVCEKIAACAFLPAGITLDVCVQQIQGCSSQLGEGDRGNWEAWAVHCLEEKDSCEDFARCYYSKNTCAPSTPIDDPNALPPALPDDLCLESDAYECDGDNLVTCKNGRWTTRSCDEVCTEGLYDHSIRCDYDEVLLHDLCYCDFESECSDDEEGAQRCGGDHYLLVCTAGEWEQKDCFEICKDYEEAPYFVECHEAKDGLQKCGCSASPP